MNHIVIVGSLNLDFVVQVATLPQPGETIRGSQFLTELPVKVVRTQRASDRIDRIYKRISIDPVNLVNPV